MAANKVCNVKCRSRELSGRRNGVLFFRMFRKELNTCITYRLTDLFNKLATIFAIAFKMIWLTSTKVLVSAKTVRDHKHLGSIETYGFAGAFLPFDGTVLADQIFGGDFVALSAAEHFRFVDEPIRIEK